MDKLLIVDDEEAMRRLLRINLADRYEIIDTGNPEQALALAMQDKPNAILLDLRMPELFRLRALPDIQIHDFHAVDSSHHRQWGSGCNNEIILQGARRHGVLRETG